MAPKVSRHRTASWPGSFHKSQASSPAAAEDLRDVTTPTRPDSPVRPTSPVAPRPMVRGTSPRSLAPPFSCAETFFQVGEPRAPISVTAALPSSPRGPRIAKATKELGSACCLLGGFFACVSGMPFLFVAVTAVLAYGVWHSMVDVAHALLADA